MQPETDVIDPPSGLLPDAHLGTKQGRLAAEGGEHLTTDSLSPIEPSFRHFAESLSDLVWSARPDGFSDYYNRRFLDYLGKTLDEMQGWTWAEALLHPDDAVGARRAWEEAYSSEGGYEVEFRLRRHDGIYRWLRSQGTPMRDDGGRITRWFGTCTDIDDRKQAEGHLALQARVLESMTEGVSVSDEGGTIVYTNPAEDRIFGYGPGELVGRHVTLLNDYPPEENERIVAGVIGQLKAEGSWSGEWKNVRKDGEAFQTFARITTIERGGRSFWVCVQEDITQRKRAEEQVRFQAHLLDAVGQAVIATDPEGRILYWNRYAESLYGWAEGEVLGRAIQEIVVAPEMAGRAEEIMARMRAGEGWSGEFRVRRRDGTTFLAFVSDSPVFDDRGRLEAIIGVSMDITERKRVEERLRLLWEAAAVLLSSDRPDAMMRGLFAKIAAHFGLDTYFNFMVDEAGDALRLESCIGIPEETARSISRLEFGQAVCGTVAQRREPIVATDIQHSDDPKVQLVKGFGIRSYACNPLMAGGTLLGTLSFASRSRDRFEDDELEFFGTVCRYVTAAYERLGLIGQLREADRRKDDFLATLAHELRNPLAPIRNALHLMGHQNGDSQANEAERAMAERQVTHLASLVDDLMDVARISKGKIELRRRPVELASVVAHAVEATRASFEGRCHQLSVSLPERPILVDADPTRLEQVLDNLLSNACKYTDNGGSITLSAELIDGWAVIRLADTGIGIPPEKLPHVFEMFAQVDHRSDHAQGGLGIGLGLVKTLVEMHGGTVMAHSKGPGHGSEFIVRLLALASPSAEVVPPRSPPEARPQELSRRRILVVDDNVDAAISLSRVLGRLYGQEVRVAHDGPSALEMAWTYLPELVILDIGMPGMDGYEVARRLRDRPETCSAHLVALTGWGQDGDRQKTRDAGFDRHLVKPVDPDALGQLLAEMRHDRDDAHAGPTR